jgi:hypothetical protein
MVQPTAPLTDVHFAYPTQEIYDFGALPEASRAAPFSPLPIKCVHPSFDLTGQERRVIVDT